MKFWFSEHLSALADSQNWADNPLLLREERRDRKRGQPWKALAVQSLALLLATIVALTVLTAIREASGKGSNPGNDLCTLLFVALAGIQVIFIAGAAQRRTLSLLNVESSQNTLSSLLLLPWRPFDILARALAFPFKAGMRMALSMLPVYVFLAALSDMPWTDVPMLYLVFAMCSVVTPRWNRPALTDAVALNRAGGASGSPRNRLSALLGGRANSAEENASGGNKWGCLLGVLGVFVVIINIVIIFLNANFPGYAQYFLGSVSLARVNYLPDSIMSLLPTAVVSWPLIVARTLVTPLLWFRMPLIPLGFVAALFAAGILMRLVKASEYLSVGNVADLPKTPTYAARRRTELALNVCKFMVAAGYLWPWLVRDGGLAWIVPPTVPAFPGLNGLAFLTMFAVALLSWIACSRVGEGLRMARRNPNLGVPRASRRQLLLFIARPYFAALVFYVVCCALGGAPLFDRSLLTLMGSMLLVSAAASLVNLGAHALLGMVAYMGVLLLPLIAAVPMLQPLAVLSPTLGLLSLGAPRLFGLQTLNAMPISAWFLTETAAGLLLYGMHLWLYRRRRSAALPDAMGAGSAAIENAIGAGAAPIENPYERSVAAVDAEDSDEPAQRSLLRKLQPLYDNAVAIKEMRTRLRNQLTWRYIAMGMVLMAALSLIVGWACPVVPRTLGGWMADLFYGPAIQKTHAYTLASIQGCWFMLMAAVGVINAFRILPAVFYNETEKSTLGFLLASTLSPRSIILGKIVGLSVVQAFPAWLIAGFTLVLSLLLVPLGDYLAPLHWLLVLFTVISVMATIVTAQVMTAGLFPKFVPVKLNGFVRFVLFFVLMDPVSRFFFLVGMLLDGFELQGYAAWAAVMACFWFLTLVFTWVACWSVGRMRRQSNSYETAAAPR